MQLKKNLLQDMYQYENQCKKEGYKVIAGTDEVGRGPMAGPLVVAAVILPDEETIPGLYDSKKLTEKQRERLSEEILKKAIEVQICYIDVLEVDELNVYQASKKGMETCIRQMKTKVDHVLTDAMPLSDEFSYTSIIHGDQLSASIAAASIVAKVERDHYMINLSKEYPQYGFEKHKGYVTKQHLEAIEKYGITPHHRKSFAPVQRILEKNYFYNENH